MENQTEDFKIKTIKSEFRPGYTERHAYGDGHASEYVGASYYGVLLIHYESGMIDGDDMPEEVRDAAVEEIASDNGIYKYEAEDFKITWKPHPFQFGKALIYYES